MWLRALSVATRTKRGGGSAFYQETAFAGRRTAQEETLRGVFAVVFEGVVELRVLRAPPYDVKRLFQLAPRSLPALRELEWRARSFELVDVLKHFELLQLRRLRVYFLVKIEGTRSLNAHVFYEALRNLCENLPEGLEALELGGRVLCDEEDIVCELEAHGVVAALRAVRCELRFCGGWLRGPSLTDGGATARALGEAVGRVVHI